MPVFNVATAAQLTTALSQAVGGDTIRLASGNYGNLDIRHFRPADLITIESANALAPAHIDQMYIQHAQNLAFRGLDIGRALTPTDFEYTRMIEVRDTTRIVFDDLDIHGSLDGLVNDGFGVFASNVSGMVVTNTIFKEHTKGILFQQSDNLQIANNTFLDMRVNGITMAAVSKVVIDGNFFQGFHPLDYDHGDAIQFFNVQQPRGSSDITIRNNVMMPGGLEPQGIWISDPTFPYHNVVIENNLMWGKFLYNGIGVNGVTGVKIKNNTIVSTAADNKSMWINLVNSTDIEMSGNVSDQLVVQGGVVGLRDVNNTFFTRDPGARALFRNLDNPTTVDDLIIPGRGYQKPVAPDAAPVADAIGGGLANLLSQVIGATVSKTAIDEVPASANNAISLTGLAADTSPTSLFGLSIEKAFVSTLPFAEDPFEWGAAHATFISTHSDSAYIPTFGSGMMGFDHFVALP